MYQQTELKNHIRLITHNISDRDSVAIGIWAGVGGRYENEKEKGSAHFLEHILFKGSRRYSCNEIKEKIEGVGGNLNAFTSEELTCYYAKIPAQHLHRTFDVLADMVLEPKIAKVDVDKERTVILEEIKMYMDLPQYLVIENLDELIWPDHPLGKSIAGTHESVSKLSSDDLRSFHRKYYNAGNTIITACGKFNYKKFEDIVRKRMGSLGGTETFHFAKADNHQDYPRIKFYKKDIEQMHLALGMLGFHAEHQDNYALSLINIILGGNMSSRLFNEVREKRGLAYSIGSAKKSLVDTGAFVIRAGVDNKKIVDALDVILKELQKFKQKEVTLSEFKRAKEYYIGQVQLGLEDTLEHMIWMGQSIMTNNRLKTLKTIIREVNKVKLSDIRRVANQILVQNKYNLSIVGPLKGDQEKEMRRLMHVAK